MEATLIQKILRIFGLWQSDVDKHNATREKLIDQNKSHEDRLKDLRKEIAKIDDQILTKEDEMNRSHGMIQESLKREIASLFHRVKNYRGEFDIIFRNIETTNTTIAKLDQLIRAIETNTDTSTLDDIAVDLGIYFDKLREQDQALRNLNKTTYAPIAPNVDITSELQQLHREIESVSPAKESISAESLQSIESSIPLEKMEIE